MTHTKVEYGPDRYTTKPVIAYGPDGYTAKPAIPYTDGDLGPYVQTVQLTPDARAALLADIRAIVREEVWQMRSVQEMADALEEVLTSAPDDDDGMRQMLLDWLRKVRLS